MIQKSRKYLLIVLLLLLVLPLSLGLARQDAECNSCASCTGAAANDSAVVNLTASFVGAPFCINVTNASVVINCASNTIFGSSANDILINASGAQNLSVVNCKLEVGYIGILLNDSSGTNYTNLTNNIFLNLSHAIVMGSNVTAYNNTFNDTGLVNNTFINFSVGASPSTCSGSQFINNTFVDGGIAGSATGDEKAIVFDIGGDCDKNNWTGNKFSMNGPRAFILKVGGGSQVTVNNTLFIRNNFMNGSLNVTNSASVHFNNSQVGNHYDFYNDSTEYCDRSQTLNDTEKAKICTRPYNLSTLLIPIENDSFPRVSQFGEYDLRRPFIASITLANLSNQSVTTFTLNLSVDDLDTSLDKCWYDTNSSGANRTFPCLGIANASIEISRLEFTNNVSIYVNDSYGNFNQTDLFVFFQDFTPANMSIIFPTNMSNVTSSNVTINISLVDLGGAQLSTCWYQLNNTGRNVTFPCESNTSVDLKETINGTELPQKGGNWTYNLTLYANDTAGNLNFSDPFVFNVDFNPPQVDMNISLSVRKGSPGTAFTMNITASDRILVVDTIRALIQNPDGNDTVTVAFAENISVNGSINAGIWNATWDSTGYPQGDYFVDIQANDSAGNTRRYDNVGLISLRTLTVDVVTNQSINLTPNITNIIEDVNLIRARLELFPNREVNDTAVSLVGYQQNPTNGSLTAGSYQPVRFMSLTFVNSTTPFNVSAATLTIFYNGTEGPSTLETSTFKIFKFLENTSTWTEVVGSFHNTTIDERYNLRSVSVNVTAFSTFAILATAKAAAVETPAANVGGGGTGGTGDAAFVKGGQTEDIGTLTKSFIERSLEKEGGVSFDVAGEKHSVKLKALDSAKKTATLEVASDPFTVIMNEDEKRVLDVTGDGIDDIEVHVASVTGIRALVKVRALEGASTKAVVEQKITETKESVPFKEQVKRVGEEIKKKIRKPNVIAWVGLLGILVAAMVVVWWHRKRKW